MAFFHKHKSGNALAISLMVLAIATVSASLLLQLDGQSTQVIQRQWVELRSQYLVESAIRLTAWQQSRNIIDTQPIPFKLKPSDISFPQVSIDSSDLWLSIEVSGKIHVDLARRRTPDAYSVGLRLLSDNIVQKISTPRILSEYENTAHRLRTQWSQALSQILHGESLRTGHPGLFSGRTRFRSARDIEEWDTLRILNGDVNLELGHRGNQSERVHGTQIIAAEGDIYFEGFAVFDTLILLAEGDILLDGQLQAKRLIAKSNGHIQCEGSSQVEARWFATKGVHLSASCQLSPWSFVVVDQGMLKLEDDSQIYGYAMVLSGGDSSGIQLDYGTKIAGLAMTRGGLDNNGIIAGMAIAQKLVGTQSGDVLLDSLPLTFPQPPAIRFDDTLQWIPISWRYL